MVRAENSSTMTMKAMTMKNARLRGRGFDLEGQSMECAKVSTLPWVLPIWKGCRKRVWIEARISCAGAGRNPAELPALL
jgi:hypothetical protein